MDDLMVTSEGLTYLERHPKTMQFLIDDLTVRGGLTPYELLARDVPDAPPNSCLGCMPEPDGKISLLKRPQALVIGHGERKTGTELETPPWLLFTVPEMLSLQAANSPTPTWPGR